jgi:transposase
MARIYKKHSSTFKAKVALEALQGKVPLGELGSKYGVAPTQISGWRNHVENGIQTLFESKPEKNHQEEIDKLHRIIGQITAERDFLVRALSR